MEALLFLSNFDSEEVPSLVIVDTYQPSGPYPVFSILSKLWRQQPLKLSDFFTFGVRGEALLAYQGANVTLTRGPCFQIKSSCCPKGDPCDPTGALVTQQF